jgi:hypothetical protein
MVDEEKATILGGELLKCRKVGEKSGRWSEGEFDELAEFEVFGKGEELVAVFDGDKVGSPGCVELAPGDGAFVNVDKGKNPTRFVFARDSLERREHEFAVLAVLGFEEEDGVAKWREEVGKVVVAERNRVRAFEDRKEDAEQPNNHCSL